MKKRLLLLLILAPCSLFLFSQSAGTKSIYRLIKDTYETKADSMTNAFIESFMIKTKGYFNDRYQYYAFNAYWTQAHAIDVVIYNYQRHKGINATLANKYLGYIRLWYKNKANNYAGAAASTTTAPNTTKDYKMFENPYTDDMCWITLSLLHIGEATGLKSYSTVAKQVFDNYIIKRATEDEETGGLKLPWHTNGGGEGPNACTQSPATLIAAKLYQKFGSETDKTYLEYAKKLYAFTSKKIVFSDGRVEDPPLTYTQGTFAEACRILYHVTDEATNTKNKYRTLAYTYLNYAFTSGRCTNGQNILRDEGSSGDQSIFKAVLIPYAVNYVLDEEMPASYRLNLYKFIVKNTDMMWKNLNLSRYPIVFCNYDWTKPYTGADSDASMGAMCSGSSLMENTARMCRAITDRYDLGTLYTQCSKLEITQGHEQDDEWSPFYTAMVRAEEILASPSDYTTAQFRDAITNLEAAYQEAQDHATGIATIQNTQSKIQNNDATIFDLSGRRVNGQWSNGKWKEGNLPRGIYIKGGRKVFVK